MSSSPQSTIMTSINPTNPNFDEHKWVINIRRTLEDDQLENETETQVSIFNVPRTLMCTDPEAYTPQQVAMGPYHCWNPELYEMQRYKLTAAKKAQKQLLLGLRFQHIVDEITKLDTTIRACYHRVLDFNHETLAWLMSIDASFLLEVLQVYAAKEGVATGNRISSTMSHLVDFEGRKSAHNAILRDFVMLENQIPLFVLRKVLEVQFSSVDCADGVLLLMLLGFCKEVSPFKMMEDVAKARVSQSSHLLDFLYDMIVPKVEVSSPHEIIQIADECGQTRDLIEVKEGSSSAVGHCTLITNIKDFLQKIWKLISKVFRRSGPGSCLKMVFTVPAKVLLCMLWAIISSLPVVSLLKQPVETLFSTQEKGDQECKESENKGSRNPSEFDRPPLVEEITIPSVTELSKSGVRFLPTNGSISTIHFDFKTATLHLPIVSLDVNTGVVLRNLVAYEASKATGPLAFTRYTELMNGIIDTEEDVKLLREDGIILNHLKSDEEAANLWNGMSKSIRLTKMPQLDKVIEDVNKYHDGRWKVKATKFIKGKMFPSWQVLTFAVGLLVLFSVAIHAFCSVHRCSSSLFRAGSPA